MSCHDLRSAHPGRPGRRFRRLSGPAPCLLAAGLVLTVGGCAAGADRSAAGSSSASAEVAADDVTQRIAAVEFDRQCAVAAQSFPDESAITTDLDTRLTAAGLTHAQWKDWHDALVDSPALVAQLTAVGTSGCPAA